MNVKKIVVAAAIGAATLGIATPAVASAQVPPRHSQSMDGVHDQSMMGVHDQSMDSVPVRASTAGLITATPGRDSSAAWWGALATLTVGALGAAGIRRRAATADQ
jgi:hypothetical protein